MIFGLINLLDKIVSSVPSVAPTFGAIFQNLASLFTTQFLVVVITFLFVDIFDTAGTLV